MKLPNTELPGATPPGHAARPEAAAGERLLLRIGSLGWWMQRFDEQGKPLAEARSASLLSLEPRGPARLQQTIQHLLASLSPGERRAADRLLLLVEGGSRMLFADAREANLATASRGAIREFGQVLLGEGEISFGFDDRLQAPAGENGTIYAFAAVSFLKELLDAFDTLALSVSHVVPVEYVLIRQSQQGSDMPGAGLILGAYESSLVLTHPLLQCHTVRSIPVGFRTLVEALRKKARLGEQQALEQLARQDAALPELEALELLVREIRRTLAFFQEQRVCSRPSRLTLHGESRLIPMLADHLASRLELAVQLPEQTLEAHFAAMAGETGFSMLQGLAERACILQTARDRYTYLGGTFVSLRDIESGRVSISGMEARSAQERHLARHEARKREERKRRQEILSRLVQDFRRWTSREPGSRTIRRRMDEWKKMQLLLLSLAGVLVGGGYLVYDDLSQEHDRQRLRLQAQQEEKQKLATRVSRLRKGSATQGAGASGQALLWSGKLFQLGPLMADTMRLKSVTFGSRRASQDKWSGILHEASLDFEMAPGDKPSFETVAAFVERLKGEKGFMEGLDEVTLTNAQEERGGQAVSARFSLVIQGHDPQKQAKSKNG